MPHPEIIIPEMSREGQVFTAGFTTRYLDQRLPASAPAGANGLRDKFRILDLWEDAPVSLAYLKQVHGTDVIRVNAAGFAGEGDGLVTNSRGVTLAIQVADCAAVLLADRHSGVVAALHSGWRGTEGNIIQRGVSAMRELGAEPPRIEAYVSPCISVSAYEVGEEVASRFEEEAVERSGYAKPHLNLRVPLRRQLCSAGITGEHIQLDDRCTYTNPDLLHSYRRDGRQSGRMVGFIRLV